MSVSNQVGAGGVDPFLAKAFWCADEGPNGGVNVDASCSGDKGERHWYTVVVLVVV